MVVWDEAENRLHVQKAILAWCLDTSRANPSGAGSPGSVAQGAAKGRRPSGSGPSDGVGILFPRADRARHSGRRSDPAVPGRSGRRGRPPGEARPVVDTILSRHDYPEPVSKLLGEAVALTALLGAALKFEGKFILQTSTDGPVDLLVADYQVPGGLRGYARFSPQRVEAVGQGDSALSKLLGQGHFAMTIDRGSDTERYQGVVPLEGESLTEAADTYFRQSSSSPPISGSPWPSIIARVIRVGGHGRGGPAGSSYRN